MAPSERTPPGILGTIGRTPCVRLPYFGRQFGANIIAKCEFFNPLGSVKDRIGRAMIEDAETSGRLKAGMRVLEPTSGNTGIGLAFVCAAKGYALTLVMPETMSLERRTLLLMLGAEIVLTPGPLGMRGAIAKSIELAQHAANCFVPAQFENPANPAVHERTTAEEIWTDTQGTFDVFVAGVGTGGTISGCGRVLKKRNPSVKVFAVEPAESAVIAGHPPGPHKIQGIGAGFIPKNLDLRVLDGSVEVSSDQALATAREIIAKEGVPAGISGGAAIYAVGELIRRDASLKGKTFVVVLPSYTERYLSTALAEEARARAQALTPQSVDEQILATVPKGGASHA